MKKKSTDFARLFEEYPDIVTVPQLREMLGVCKANACQLLNSGQIKCFRVGNVYRIPKVCVYEFLNEQTKLPHGKK